MNGRGTPRRPAFRYAAYLLAVAFILLIAGLALRPRAPEPAGGPARLNRPATTLVIGRPADSVTLDPAATTRMSDFLPISLAYERLVEPVIEGGRPTGELRGSLARSWSVSADGLVWTFSLHDGHRFSDGSAVTGDAVRASFRRLLAIGRGPAQVLEMVERVDSPDARTVSFRLRRVFPAFGQLLTLPMFSIVGPAVASHAVDGDHGAYWLSSRSLGSGPYRVGSWQRSQRILLTTNPHSAVRPRYFDAVRLEVIEDAVSRLAQARRGDIDVVGSPTPEMVSRLAEIPHLVSHAGPGPILYYLELNNGRPPFSNIAVRKAVALSIDRSAIIEGIFGGAARPVRGVLPEGMPGHNPALPLPKADLAEARQQLGASGWQPGTLRLSYSPTTPTLDALAIAVQANLAQIGIRLRIESLAPSAFNEKVRFAGDFDMALRIYTADFPDPWIIMDPVYLGSNAGPAGNVSRYANPAVDRLLQAAASARDPEQRISLYRHAQGLIASDQPHVILLAADGLVAYRNEIAGVTPNFWQPGLLNVAQMTRRSGAGTEGLTR